LSLGLGVECLNLGIGLEIPSLGLSLEALGLGLEETSLDNKPANKSPFGADNLRPFFAQKPAGNMYGDEA